ncbi:hypothetical protein F511_21768 [Dorcoceras hygrometricum]|uniref:Uncharacterized protein n=1 Tax=Dorcoceras hygrometricum TaxID=472368 RepID=A0A2Z7A8Z0_9LAMI|nr:hypothetical protein F511_21768 [Dorcoceras hygrometricum]
MEDVHDNTSYLSDHLPPALTADYLNSMKTSEPKAQQVFQDLQLVEVLIQLVVPQEVVRVSQLCIVFICTGITAGGMSRVMLTPL